MAECFHDLHGRQHSLLATQTSLRLEETLPEETLDVEKESKTETKMSQETQTEKLQDASPSTQASSQAS